MSYEKLNLINGEKFSAEHVSHIEDGIVQNALDAEAQINQIKGDLVQVSGYNQDIIVGEYVYSADGSINNNNSYSRTDYIPIKKGSTVTINNFVGTDGCNFISMYDLDKMYIDRKVRGSGLTTPISGTYTIDYDGYVILSFYNQGDYGNPTYSVESYNINSIFLDLVKKNHPFKDLNSIPTFITSFRKIACIGDSLTEGFFNTTNDGVVIKELSYPAVMQRLTGCEVKNFGISGIMAKVSTGNGWYTKALANGWFSGDNICDLYIIALGTNDLPFSGNPDTSIDVNNPSNNTEDSCGSYATIISKIKQVQPKAVIMCVTIPNTRNTSTERNSANDKIRAIANKFRAYVIDLQKYAEQEGEEATYYSNEYKNGSHDNALGYNLRARQFISYIDWIIAKNLGSFQNIQFIGTDYNY